MPEYPLLQLPPEFDAFHRPDGTYDWGQVGSYLQFELGWSAVDADYFVKLHELAEVHALTARAERDAEGL